MQNLKAIIHSLSTESWLISPEGREQIEALEGSQVTGLIKAKKTTQTSDNGQATLNITGPLVRYQTPLIDALGWTSTESLMASFKNLDQSDDVTGITLDFDSPGGMVSGTHEFSNVIRSANKPITAYTSGFCCSAAYWLASQCESIVISPTGIMGCIGVMAPRPSNNSGVMTSKHAANKLLTASAMQQVLDDLEAVLIADIAAGRGVSAEHVVANYGKGKSFVGQKAVNAGLADSIGTYSTEANAVLNQAGSNNASSDPWDDVMSDVEEAENHRMQSAMGLRVID